MTDELKDEQEELTIDFVTYHSVVQTEAHRNAAKASLYLLVAKCKDEASRLKFEGIVENLCSDRTEVLGLIGFFRANNLLTVRLDTERYTTLNENKGNHGIPEKLMIFLGIEDLFPESENMRNELWNVLTGPIKCAFYLTQGSRVRGYNLFGIEE